MQRRPDEREGGRGEESSASRTRGTVASTCSTKSAPTTARNGDSISSSSRGHSSGAFTDRCGETKTSEDEELLAASTTPVGDGVGGDNNDSSAAGLLGDAWTSISSLAEAGASYDDDDDDERIGLGVDGVEGIVGDANSTPATTAAAAVAALSDDEDNVDEDAAVSDEGADTETSGFYVVSSLGDASSGEDDEGHDAVYPMIGDVELGLGEGSPRDSASAPQRITPRSSASQRFSYVPDISTGKVGGARGQQALLRSETSTEVKGPRDRLRHHIFGKLKKQLSARKVSKMDQDELERNEQGMKASMHGRLVVSTRDVSLHRDVNKDDYGGPLPKRCAQYTLTAVQVRSRTFSQPDLTSCFYVFTMAAKFSYHSSF